MRAESNQLFLDYFIIRSKNNKVLSSLATSISLSIASSRLHITVTCFKFTKRLLKSTPLYISGKIQERGNNFLPVYR